MLNSSKNINKKMNENEIYEKREYNSKERWKERKEKRRRAKHQLQQSKTI